jgi:lysophospholipase L1-like esterase
MRKVTFALSLFLTVATACTVEPDDTEDGGSTPPATGGAPTTTGGSVGTGASSTGGASGGVGATGGAVATGGTVASGGAIATGGALVTGGTGTGSTTSAGGAVATGGSGTGGGEQHWVGTWATGNQTTEQANLPPSPGLANNTLRQIVRVSIGGTQLRLRLSNEYGTAPVTLNAVHVAKAMTGSSIDTSTDVALAFNGAPSVTIPAKQTVTSDPFDFALAPLSTVAITIAFGAQSGDVTGHPGSRTTSYLQSNNVASAASVSGSTTDHWYFIANIDVMADASTHAIAILGDSITDGRGATTNGNDRWPDILANRLQADAAHKNVAVLNLGIGGNKIVGTGGLGPSGVTRFQSQILGQSGVRWVVILEGINDIGGSTSGDALIGAYQQLIDQAHAEALLVYGIPILPFAGNSYDMGDNQTDRTKANDWIRAPGSFDGFLAIDSAVSDGKTPPGIKTDMDYQDDRLHLNPQGAKALADAIDLTLFTP